jgi:hypothetical protein
MYKKALYTVLLFLVFIFTAVAQNAIKGIVYDAETKKPLPFVNVAINNGKTGTTSDIDGHFKWQGEEKITKIGFSYIGYDKKEITDTIAAFMPVYLSKSTTVLEEVVIKPGENPANRIIKNTIKNREKYNPEKLSSFQFKAYNNLKMYVDFPPNANLSDTSIQAFKNNYLFLMESITEKSFIYPDKHKEKVLANKVSGFKNPSFSFFVSDLQPFGLYSDYLQIAGVKYLNPIANGSLKKYQYEIKDTHFVHSDTVFIIAFEPKKNANIEGLKGLLYINSSYFVVQNLLAEPAETDKNALIAKIKINHQYTKNEENIWFPEQLNIYYDFPNKDLNSRNSRLLGESKTYVKELKTNIDLDRKIFNEILVEFDQAVNGVHDTVWQNYRYTEDLEKELRTYRFVDSLSRAIQLEKRMKIAESLITGRIPVKMIDIDLKKLMNYNRYEGYRLGLGLVTNDKLTKYAELGGYFAYGFSDKAFKYGSNLKLKFSKRFKTYLEGSYTQDIAEMAGNQKPFITTSSITSDGKIRNYLVNLVDSTQQLKIETGSRFLKLFEFKTAYSIIRKNPTYQYRYIPNNSSEFNYEELSIAIRFAYNEKFVQSFGNYISVGTQYPIVQLQYTEGIKNLQYRKIQVFVDDNITLRNVGVSSYRLNAGTLQGDSPYFLHFNGGGSFHSKYRIYSGYSFETMGVNEFLSNNFVSLHYVHQFGNLLFKTEKFKPKLAIAYNGGWGTLTNTQNQEGIMFKSMEKGYHETGILINNLLKSAFSELGVSCFYRMGAYANTNSIDNFVVKLTLTSSFGF